MSNQAKVVETSTADKVLTISLELMQAEQDYKDTAKAHRENIKRIKAELKELLEAENEVPANKV